MSPPHNGFPAGSTASDRVDVLIIGSGPIGATFAREIGERLPDCSIMMVDRGPVLAEPAGTNLNNFLPGGVFSADSAVPDELIPRVPPESLARSGTQLLRQAAVGGGGMPAAAVSTNVGGMGAHWSCATPAPGDDERTDLIPPEELDLLLARAAELLQSTTAAFEGSARGAAMGAALSAAFDGLLDRPVQVMPHACTPTTDHRLAWTGSDTVLGPLRDAVPRFELLPETLCTELLVDGHRVIGAALTDLGSGKARTVLAQVVVVACDSLRTPQLLWASGIRPAALGRYLNEHPMVGATVVLSDEIIAAAKRRQPGVDENFAADPLAALWIPYAASTHRFSGQIENSPGSPAGFRIGGLDRVEPSRVVSLTWFCPKKPRREDRIGFTGERGLDGLPIPLISYTRTPDDDRVVDRAIELAQRAGAALGEFVAGQHPALLADGQSLHYMGTVRMGGADDGTSVCDTYSRVWGLRGLYVGGNGVIPVPTACNPTLTSVALAVRAAHAVGDELRATGRQQHTPLAVHS